MRGKWVQSLKRFIELFTPGGTEYTDNGIAIVYSRTGGMTIPRSEYPKIIDQMLAEREKSLSRSIFAANRERAD